MALGWEDAEDTLVVIIIVLHSTAYRNMDCPLPDQDHHHRNKLRSVVSAVHLGQCRSLVLSWTLELSRTSFPLGRASMANQYPIFAHDLSRRKGIQDGCLKFYLYFFEAVFLESREVTSTARAASSKMSHPRP